LPSAFVTAASSNGSTNAFTVPIDKVLILVAASAALFLGIQAIAGLVSDQIEILVSDPALNVIRLTGRNPFEEQPVAPSLNRTTAMYLNWSGVLWLPPGALIFANYDAFGGAATNTQQLVLTIEGIQIPRGNIPQL
jgi:hypothetical protein